MFLILHLHLERVNEGSTATDIGAGQESMKHCLNPPWTMRSRVYRLAALVVATGFALLTANCSRSQPTTARPVAQQVIDKVWLRPIQPRATDTIQAIVTGKGVQSAERPYHFRWTINDQDLPGNDQDRLAPSNFHRHDRIWVAVVIGDASRETEVRSDPIMVANSPCNIRSTKFSPREPTSSTPIELTVDAGDPDQDQVSIAYRWRVNDTAVVTDDATLTPDSFKRGDTISVEISCSDGIDTSPAKSLRLTVIQNSVPTINSDPSRDTTGYRYQVIATDADNDPLVYTIDSQPPMPGLSISEQKGTVLLPISPPPGTYTIEIVATDPLGARVTQHYRLAID